MFLRNRVTGQVHDVPDHLVHGFHTAQEVDGFGEPLGLPFLAALAPMLTDLLPAVLPAIGSLFKGGASGPPPAPAPPPAPVVMSPPPPPPPPPMEMPPESMPGPRRMVSRQDRGPDDDMPPPRPGVDPMDAGGPPPPPPVAYRGRRRVRRRVRRGAAPQVHGYGWWY
jgi:hypothetical protein